MIRRPHIRGRIVRGLRVLLVVARDPVHNRCTSVPMTDLEQQEALGALRWIERLCDWHEGGGGAR
jgi:hypothetical protein